ncbi:TRAF-like family protein [Citrus sinensis]|uniref:TRAF-like family protein n=1 Tax=Citrus sinensis TaxID=2711 RepID=A0ACB8IAL3_CITSI|nr:TRAF-like family protein [Citrus sinensis]
MCTSARKREDRLANLTHELPAYSSLILGEDPRADTAGLSANAWGCENPPVRPACRPLRPKGWGPACFVQDELHVVREEVEEVRSDWAWHKCTLSANLAFASTSDARRIDMPKPDTYDGIRNATIVDNFLFGLDQYFDVMVEKYESGDFEAGGYKWKLVLYPAGNKSKNVKEHISVYLAMENTSSLQHGWEVYAVFRLFLLDQNKGNFLILQDAMGIERRFHRLKLEWGFDEFIPIKAFNDASNGFLLEDTCVFGAEVFVSKERSTGKGECLSMIKDAPSIKHVWRIDNFSKLRSECCDSQVFNSGDQKWKIQLYPTGRRHGTGTHLAMYLALADSTTLTPGSKIYAEFTVRLLDQVQARHIAANFWFSASNPESGWARYVSFAYFNNPGNGCLVKDVCSVEAEVTVHGVSNAL